MAPLIAFRHDSDLSEPLAVWSLQLDQMGPGVLVSELDQREERNIDLAYEYHILFLLYRCY